MRTQKMRLRPPLIQLLSPWPLFHICSVQRTALLSMEFSSCFAAGDHWMSSKTCWYSGLVTFSATCDQPFQTFPGVSTRCSVCVGSKLEVWHWIRTKLRGSYDVWLFVVLHTCFIGTATWNTGVRYDNENPVRHRTDVCEVYRVNCLLLELFGDGPHKVGTTMLLQFIEYVRTCVLQIFCFVVKLLFLFLFSHRSTQQWNAACPKNRKKSYAKRRSLRHFDRASPESRLGDWILGLRRCRGEYLLMNSNEGSQLCLVLFRTAVGNKTLKENRLLIANKKATIIENIVLSDVSTYA